MATSGTLYVRRHDVVCRVARGHGSAASGIGLGEVLGSALVERLAAELESSGVVDGVWLVGRLDVRVAVAGSSGPRRVTNALADQVAAELRRVVAAGLDGDNVRWFPDRAAFLGSFLIDRATDRAGGRWEYREFDDDPTRSASQSIVAEFSRTPGDSLDALRRLKPSDVEIIIDAISPDDAAGALRSLASVGERDAHRPFDALIEAARNLRGASRLPRHAAGVALRIFVAAVRSGLAAASPVTASRADEAARLVVVLNDAVPVDAENLARAIAAGCWHEIGSAQLKELSGIAAWPQIHLQQFVEAVAPDSSSADLRSSLDTYPSVQSGTILRTGLGGMFLLLPLLAELPLTVESATWPPLDDIPATRLVGFLATISALGADRNSVAATDPVLRLALRLPSRLDIGAVSAWGNECALGVPASSEPSAYSTIGRPFELLPAANAVFASAGMALGKQLARSLPGLSESSLPYLWRNILDFQASVDIQPDQFVATLTNPPLHLLLTMAGLNSQRFSLDLERGPVWVLTQAG